MAENQGDTQKRTPTAEEIEDWLVSYVAQLLEIEPMEVDVTVPFNSYDLDSAAAIGIAGELEQWLKFKLDPILLYDYPTIERLATYLASSSY